MRRMWRPLGTTMQLEDGVYLACIHQGNLLGIASYDATNGTLQCTETTEDPDGDFLSLQLMKFQVHPAVCYTSLKSSDALIECLKKPDPGCSEEYDVKLVKRLCCLSIGSSRVAELSPAERLMRLHSAVDMGRTLQVRAAGALVALLQKEGVALPAGEGEDEAVAVQVLREASLQGYLFVDHTTYAALQIFRQERHPSQMGIGKAKEGFSLFGMLNKCVTVAGRKLLRSWFLRPVASLEIITERQDAIAFLLGSPDLMFGLRKLLKNVKSLQRALKKLQSPNHGANVGDFRDLLETITQLLRIREMLEAALAQSPQGAPQGDVPLLRKLSKCFNEDMLHIHDLITSVVDFEQECSGVPNETLVKYAICPELDELKLAYESLPSELALVAEEELSRVPEDMRHLFPPGGSVVVYIPQVGYVMRWPLASGERLSGRVLQMLPDAAFAFEGRDAEGQGVYYYTRRTRELDNVYGDLYHKILDVERSLLQDLEARIASRAHALMGSAALAAELDSILSLSLSAREYNYTRPQVCTEDVLEIKNGRHPLQELRVDGFVPNDTRMGQDERRIHVITGPNFSGKSVLVKQVALIVFLAHIGSYVPAEEARIGITDRIFSRVESKETLASSNSTFMIDLHQMASMTRNATSRSLLVIDEAGKGTLNSDGVGLLCSLLHHFAQLDPCPKVLCCTHFSEVYDETNLPPQMPRAACMANNGTRLSTKACRGTWIGISQLAAGTQTPSYGVHCARLGGIPGDILSRARDVIELVRDRRPINRALHSAQTAAKDEAYKVIVDKIASFDFQGGDVLAFLQEVFALCASPLPPSTRASEKSRS
eukprot:jgi/Mesvir1/9021/Mv21306-RA.1